jgi:predicted amidophosphoribosyltransferase
MSHLDRHQRALNLEGAFRVHEKVAEKFSGKRLLLVDDVYTTGTTASQCTLVLMEQGAEAVYVITLAAGAN